VRSRTTDTAGGAAQFCRRAGTLAQKFIHVCRSRRRHGDPSRTLRQSPRRGRVPVEDAVSGGPTCANSFSAVVV